MAQQPISNAQLADVSGSKVIGDITGKSANVNGVVAIANGGTGKTTAEEALNALLPDQTGKNTYTLRTNGTTANWAISGTVFSVGINPGTTGLTVSGTNPVTTSGTLTLGGTLAVSNGGTGGTNRLTALTNLLPVQSPSTAGLGLISDGAQATWQGIVSSVDLSTGTTGLTVSGGPITSSGTFTLGGTLAIANGGTGKTTRQEAIDNLVPVQTGQTGKFLSTNGATVSWQTVSATPGGSTGAIQFNNSGAFGGDSKLTYSGTGGGTLSIGTPASSFNIRAADGVTNGYYGISGTSVVLRAGDCQGGYVLGVGGSISLIAGNATPQLSQGGSISLTAGIGETNGNLVLNNNRGVTIFQNSTTELARITNGGAWSFGSSGTNFGSAGQALVSNGNASAPTWQTLAGTGTVTSVGISGGTTGLTVSGSPVTVAGTMTLSGTLAAANGGTGLTSVPGTSGSILYNNAGAYAGATNLSFTNATATLIVGNSSSSTNSVIAAGLGSTVNYYPSSNLLVRAGDTGASIGYGGNLTLRAGNGSNGEGGITYIYSGSGGAGQPIIFGTGGTVTERFRITPAGSWSLGSTGTATGTAGQTIVSGGATAVPSWAYPSAVGSPSPATNATTGFAYIPVTTGTPTGVPTAITGFAPMMADSSGNRLWIYIGGSWKSVALA